MRPFRAMRLLMIPAVAVALMLSALVASGSAWARVPKSKSALCKTLSSTGGVWSLAQCTAPTETGGNSTAITPQPFPTTAGTFTVVITWNNAAVLNPETTPKTTIRATASKPFKDRCAAGSTEWQLIGSVTGNTAVPGVSGRVKILACVTKSGAVSNTFKGNKVRQVKL